MYKPYYFPKPAQPDKLYIIDKSGMTNHEKIMLASMQGVTAKDKPCIWLEMHNPSYTLWLERIVSDLNIGTENVPDIYDLLEKTKASYRGYLLYDLTDGTSLNVATSLAGIYHAVMVDVKIEDKIREKGLVCLKDVRGLDDQWLYDNYKDKFGQGEDLLNSQIILEQRALENDERYYTLRDYAIFCNMATVYQSVSPLMDSFLKLIDDDSIILGWGDGDGCGEDNLGTIAARNGVMRVASDWASNLSVLAAVEPKAVYSQSTESDPSALVTENKHYITFIWTDGDNIQWTNGSFSHHPTFWGSPSRGKLNLGWGINQLLYEVAPTTLDYYYESSANTAQGKDYFVVGPHFAYAKYFHPTLPAWTEHLDEMMGRTGLKYVQINELMTMCDLPEAFDDYTEHENIEGLFYIEYCKYDYWQGRMAWSNGKPVVSARYAIWDPNQMDDASPDDVLRKLDSAVVDPTSPEGYSFITVHAWSGYTTDDLYAMIGKLDDRFKVVTPDEFMQQIKKNVVKRD